jgi:hypothetical protein
VTAFLLGLAVLGSWTVCAAAPPWTPPIGIPAPGFGIGQTTDDATFTHWVDNSGPCTDSGNDGTPARPRCTIPTTLAAGSIVQVRGGPYSLGSQTWTLKGMASRPVYVRGPSSGPRPYLGNRANVAMAGTYAIVENLKMRRWSFAPGSGNHHLALRHCEVTDHRGTGAAVGVGAGNTDIVIYDCEIARNGRIPSAADHHGINMWGAGISNVWIVDNHIHHNSGDAVQFCHRCNFKGPPNDGPAHVYIGRNDMHHDEENAIDLKEFMGPVVVSQNRLWGYRAITSGRGEAIRVNDEGQQGEAWILFNDIWDSGLGVNSQGSGAFAIYIIGNEIHDIVADDANGVSGVPAAGSGVVRVINNTIVNVTDGILAGQAKSNIIRATGKAIGPNATACSHNFVQQGTIGLGCANAYAGDPRLMMAGTHVTGLQPGSAAIDAGFPDHVAYSTYQTRYGLDIRFDRAGVPRPSGAAWDIGAHEATRRPAPSPPATP